MAKPPEKSPARLAAEERVLRERMVPRIAKAYGFSNAEIDAFLLEMQKEGGFFYPDTNKLGLPREGGYKHQRFVAAHELGHAKDYKLNPDKTKRYFRSKEQAHVVRDPETHQKITRERNVIPVRHGTDALRMETYANKQVADYLKSVGGTDPIGERARNALLLQERLGKNFLWADEIGLNQRISSEFSPFRGRGDENITKMRHLGHAPYRYGATMMRRAGHTGLGLPTAQDIAYMKRAAAQNARTPLGARRVAAGSLPLTAAMMGESRASAPHEWGIENLKPEYFKAAWAKGDIQNALLNVPRGLIGKTQLGAGAPTGSNYAIPGRTSQGMDWNLALDTLIRAPKEAVRGSADLIQMLATGATKIFGDVNRPVPGAPITGYDPTSGHPQYEGDPYDYNSPAGRARREYISQKYRGR